MSIESSAITAATTSSTSPARESEIPEEPTCSTCGIKKVLAESRLHQGWPWEKRSYASPNLSIDDFQAGSKSGCNVCSLVVDAFTVCVAQDLEVWDSNLVCYKIEFGDTHCRFTISDDIFQRWLLFCSEGGESAWNLVKLPHPSGDTSSLQAVKTIQRWMETCINQHEHCKQEDRTHSIPMRMLKLSDGHVWLCEGINAVPQYACLSHCWGPKGPALKLNSETMDELTAGICVDRLPKTFHDAVVLCLNLSIQYLWIDALCILQDNEDDWKRAAASMADIYAGATITIAATWSDDSDGGCFSRMLIELNDIPLQESGVFVRPRKPNFPRTLYTESSESWPLLDRAWVYQERKLSARVVHLAKRQLYWECDSTFNSEDGLEDLESGDEDLRASIEDPTIAWRHAVSHYSRLKLTFEKDRLPARSAVVQRMQPLRAGDVYIAGMWLNSLLIDLTWLRLSSEVPPRSREVKHPSWSWVSITQGVSWREGCTPLSSTRLIDVTYDIVGPAHFGSTSEASITVEGPTVSVANTWKRGDANVDLLGQLAHHRGVITSAFAWPDFDYTTADPPIPPGQACSLLLMNYESYWRSDMRYFNGIVLRKIEGGKHERIGWALVHVKTKDKIRSDAFIPSLPIKRFTIV